MSNSHPLFVPKTMIKSSFSSANFKMLSENVIIFKELYLKNQTHSRHVTIPLSSYSEMNESMNHHLRIGKM